MRAFGRALDGIAAQTAPRAEALALPHHVVGLVEMLTSRMCGFLHHRLAANAPQQAGSHEYLVGVHDAIAAVRRLVDVSAPASSTTTWSPEEPRQTRLAAEYLELEMRTLVWMLDSLLQQPAGPGGGHGELPTSSWQEARDHLLRARAALHQAAKGPAVGPG